MSSLGYLKPLGLDMYVAAFDDEGFEDATLLDDANLDMLTNEMKMKSGHARKLLKYLEKQGILATTDSNEVKSSSVDYLEEIGLDRYARSMDEEGYEEIENLEGVTAENLVKEVKGMKRGHAKKIVRYVAEKLASIEAEEEPNKTAGDIAPPNAAPTLQHVNTTSYFASHASMMQANASATLANAHLEKNPDLKWHAFMSHMQAEGGDAVMAIDMHLSPRGWILWTDQSPNADVTQEGMKNGVRQSLVYVLYCTKSVFQRPFVRLELLEAVKQNKPILMLYEEDRRRAAFTFDGKTGVPPGFRPITEELLRNHCAIPWERRPHLRKATIELIETRIAETVTGKGVGLKPLNVSTEAIATAEKCCFDDAKKEEETKKADTTTTTKKADTTTTKKKADTSTEELPTELTSWRGKGTFDTEPNILPKSNGILISGVKPKGTRAKWQVACDGLYRATDQIVNGKRLYYHIGERRYLYYSDTYHNWLATNDKTMFAKGMGYLRTRSKHISDPSEGLKVMELYDNSVWVDSSARVTSLTTEELHDQMRKLRAKEQAMKQSARGIVLSGIVGKGTRKANQDKLNQKYFADLNSWQNGRYNLYINEKADSFLFYNNKYENWVITNKYDAFGKGVGYARSQSVHSKHPGNMIWEIYDSSWEVATGATSALLPVSECDAALKRRLNARALARSKKQLVLKGYSYEYDGIYTQDPNLMVDGRAIYSKDGKKFVYYTTIYNNWLLTNARSNFAKGAGLFRTTGTTHDLYPPSTLSWQVYDYSVKKWVARSGCSLTHS